MGRGTWSWIVPDGLWEITKDGNIAVRTNRGTYWDSGKVMITL
ncbi:hypothetical protein [Streptomyces bacillaris]